jgi:hypothetical protein
MISALKKLTCAWAGTVCLVAGGNLSASQILIVPTPVRVETLSEHLTSQLASRTNGGTFNFLEKDDTGASQVYFNEGYPSVVTNFWLRGVTNILGQSVACKIGTNFWVTQCLMPVSPRHCITAWHTSQGDFLTRQFIWMLPGGGLYTNTATAITNLGNDLCVALMAQTNPTVFKVMGDISRKVKFTANYPNPPVCVRGRWASVPGPVTTFVSGIQSQGTYGAYVFGQFKYGDYGHGGDIWNTGDSSTPAICVINGEAIFLGAAYTAQGSPWPGLQTNAVNAAMTALLPGYALQLADLSQWPDVN